MRRNSVQTLLVATLLLTALLAFLPVGVQAVGPCRPSEASGTWDFTIPDTVEQRQVGNNLIIHLQGGGGNNYGDLEGFWIHDEWDIVNLVTGKVHIIGTWDGENTIEGKTGNLHVRYWGTADATGFHGRWVILSGTDELENLHGHGNVWADASGMGSTLKYCFT
jgi:hypothetical protein